MNQSIATLTATLQKSLNSNYEVTDMATVLFVISQLENTKITKEQLETTRLARYINQLRRRTWSESLARRAKNLIKKWREMVIPTLGTQQQQSNSIAAVAGVSDGDMINLQQQQQQQEQLSLRPTSSGSGSQPTSPTMLSTNSPAISAGGHLYQQHHHQQQHFANYDLNFDTRSSSKNIESSLPEYPTNNYNRKLMNTGSANKRNEQQILIDDGNTEHRQKQYRYRSAVAAANERSLSEYCSSKNYNRKSNNNTGSTNEMEQQQLIISNGGGGSNLSIDDRLMMSIGRGGGGNTSSTRIKMKTSKFDNKSDFKSSKKGFNRNQPISFANLLPSTQIDGIGLHSLSPAATVQSAATFVVDDRSHSPVVISPSSSRKSKLLSHSIDHHRRSPVTIEHSVSPLDFDHNSNPSRDNSIMMLGGVGVGGEGGGGRGGIGSGGSENIKNNTDSAAMYCNSSSNNKPSSIMMNGDSRSRLPQMMIELNDSNSNSNLMMINTLDSSIQPPSPLINLYNNISLCNLDDNETQLTEHRKSKKHKKDKKKQKQSQQQQNQQLPEIDNRLLVESGGGDGNGRPLLSSDQMNIEGKHNYHHHHQQHPDTIFPPHDSLSNSSLSIFPNTSTNTTAVTLTAANINRDNIDGGGGKCDLTFAGKFNKNFNSYSNNTLPPNRIEEISSQQQREQQQPNFPIMMNAQNNTGNISSSSLSKKLRRKEPIDSSVVVIESRSCSPFTSIAGNSDDSCTSSSHISSNHHDMIDVMTNHESQSGIIDVRTVPPITTTKSSGRQQHSKLIIKHGGVAMTEGGTLMENTGPVTTHKLKSSLISGNNGVSIGTTVAGTATISIVGDSVLEQQQKQLQNQQFISSTVATTPPTTTTTTTKTPKKRGRKKKLKTVEPPPTTPGNFLNTQLFENSRLLSIATLTTNKKVKTTKELLADIQNRKLESATSSPTLMHSQSSRLPSPCSDTSLQSPITSDACSTNATMSTIARSTPDLQTNLIAARSGDVIDDSASDSNTTSGINIQKSIQSGLGNEIRASGSGVDCGSKIPVTDGEIASAAAATATEKHQNFSSSLSSKQQQQQRTVEDEIADIMKLLPPIDRSKIQWHCDNEIICTCQIKETEPNHSDDEKIKVEFQKDDEKDLSILTATSPMVVISPGNATMAPIISASSTIKSLKSFSDENSISMLLSSSKSKTPPLLTSPCSKSRDGSPITIGGSEKINLNATINRKPPIKSIFDLDYDDDDDPLNSIVEAANKSQLSSFSKVIANDNDNDKKNEINDNYNDDDDDGEGDEDYNNENDIDDGNGDDIIKKRKKKSKRRRRQQQQPNSEIIDNSSTTPSSTTQQSLTSVMLKSLKQQQQIISGEENIVTNNQNQSQQPLAVPQFPQYEIIEDLNCPAKQLYVTQRNRISLYHVNALHNRFISNVNGNWDHSSVITTKMSTTTAADYIISTDDAGNSRLKLINSNSDNEDNDELTSDDLYKRVVPQYNHIIMDRIPKDLSHIQFTKNYKIKRNFSNKIKKNIRKFELKLQKNIENEYSLLNHRISSLLSESSATSMTSLVNNDNDNDNYMTLHKPIKRKRLDDDDDDNKKDRNDNDDNMNKNLNTVKCEIENNLNNDSHNDNNEKKIDVIEIKKSLFSQKDDELNNSDNNRNSHKITTATTTTSKRSSDVGDATMMMNVNDYENMISDDGDDGGDMVIKAIDNESPIKLENHNNKNSAEIVIMMETVDDKQKMSNSNELNNITTTTTGSNATTTAAVAVAVGMTIIQQQKDDDNDHERINNEQKDNIHDNDDAMQLNSKNNKTTTTIGNRRHRRSSSCSSSSSNYNININLNNHNNNDNNEISNNNNNNNNRHFINNDNDDDNNINNLNSSSVSVVEASVTTALANNCFNDDGDDLSVDHDDNHQSSSQHSMHSNYTEEHYDDDGGSENDYEDDEDYNDDDEGGGHHHHRVVVKHDMISSTSTTSQKHIVLTIKKTPVDNFKQQQQGQKKSKDLGFLSSSLQQQKEVSMNAITINIAPATTTTTALTPTTITITTTNTENTTGDAVIDNNDGSNVITRGNEKSLISLNFESNNNNNNSQNNNTTTTTQQKDSSSLSNCLEIDRDLLANDDNMAVSSDNAVNYIKSDNKSNNLNSYDDNISSIIKIDDNDKNKNNLLIKTQIKSKTIESDDDDGDNNYDNKVLIKNSNSNHDENDTSYDDYQKNENSEFIKRIQKFEENCDDINDNSDDDDDNYEYNIDSLPIENNGLLESFNNLNEENITGIRKISKLKNEYSSKIINSNSSSNYNGTNNQQQQQDEQQLQQQQFKEWHEVHQVRSYNDDLLTILPYVVID